ncbi:MAG: phytoene/squalene synthase family protein [Nitratireductor sp.]
MSESGVSETGPEADPEAETAGRGACARLVKRYDPDRFLLAIAAPASARPALFALYAFNAEVAKTREVVSEAMLGDIRLQWWREAIEECYAGRARRHEVVRPLAQAIEAHAPDRALFDALIDARARDLDDAPIESVEAFQAYAEATSGGLIRLAAQILGAEETPDGAEAARHVGIAYALTGQIRALPYSLPHRRTLLPREPLRAAGADEQVMYRAKPDPKIAAGVGALLEQAEAHLTAARSLRDRVPDAATPAFLAARLATAYVKQLRRVGGDPFDGRLERRPPTRILSLMWGAKTGRW